MTDPPRLQWYLRRAIRTDVDSLTRLARAAKASWGYPEFWIDSWALQLVIAAEYIDQHRVTVACTTAGDVFGGCAIENHGDHWMLEHVWVSPLVHRQGVGRFLVLDALGAARRLSAVPVRLLADPFAREFYARLGARVTGWVAAPMEGKPGRRLPQMEFAVEAQIT